MWYVKISHTIQCSLTALFTATLPQKVQPDATYEQATDGEQTWIHDVEIKTI